MQVFQCAQRRCRHKFDAELAPVVCPKCGCAWANGNGAEHDWSDYTKADLLDVAEINEVAGVANKKKADIITALEAAGLDPGS